MIKITETPAAPTKSIRINSDGYNLLLSKPDAQPWNVLIQGAGQYQHHDCTIVEKILIKELLKEPETVTAWVPSLSRWVEAVVVRDATNPILGELLDEKP